MGHSRIVLWGASLFTWMGAACQRAKNTDPSPEWIQARQKIPLYEARGYRLEWIDTAGQRLFISARQVFRLRQRDTILWRMVGEVYAAHLNGGGDTLETLQSEIATVYPDRLSFIAERNVFLKTSDGLRLETDYLVWDHDKSLIVAPGWVRLQTPKETLRGEGLEYHTTTRSYKLRRTRGTVQSPL